MKIKSRIAFALVSLFSFQTLSVLSSPIIQKKDFEDQLLIAAGEDENHYHEIKSIRLNSNGNLKVKFCGKVELLEGQIYANNTKYDVNDAYKIKSKSISWKLNKKDLFKKGSQVEINTVNFLGRPKSKSDSDEIKFLDRGCGIIYADLPRGVEVKGNDAGPLGIVGLALVVGIGIGAGGSGSRSTSSN